MEVLKVFTGLKSERRLLTQTCYFELSRELPSLGSRNHGNWAEVLAATAQPGDPGTFLSLQAPLLSNTNPRADDVDDLPQSLRGDPTQPLSLTIIGSEYIRLRATVGSEQRTVTFTKFPGAHLKFHLWGWHDCEPFIQEETEVQTAWRGSPRPRCKGGAAGVWKISAFWLLAHKTVSLLGQICQGGVTVWGAQRAGTSRIYFQSSKSFFVSKNEWITNIVTIFKF